MELTLSMCLSQCLHCTDGAHVGQNSTPCLQLISTLIRNKPHKSIVLQDRVQSPIFFKLGPVRTHHSSHDFGWQSSHSVDLAGWQAKMHMASIDIWIAWRYAHKPHCLFLAVFCHHDIIPVQWHWCLSTSAPFPCCVSGICRTFVPLCCLWRTSLVCSSRWKHIDTFTASQPTTKMTSLLSRRQVSITLLQNSDTVSVSLSLQQKTNDEGQAISFS